MPIFVAPGVIIPGQFGPISVTPSFSITLFTFTISSSGIPSVMQTIVLIPLPTASIMASAANGGGTKIKLTFG